MVYIKAMFMIKVLLRLTITVMLGKCDGDNHTVNVRDGDGAGCRDVTGVIDGDSDDVSEYVGVYECDSVGMASADGGKVCC